MTRQQVIDAMRARAQDMQNLTVEFNLTPERLFDKLDTAVMIDPPPGSGGYPKFPAKGSDLIDLAAANDLQRRWLAISTQLAKKITNPHVSLDDINAIFNGIGMLGGLYAEKFKS